MKVRGVFSGRSAIFQIFLLISFVLVGAILATLISLIPIGVTGGIDQNPDVLRLYQLLSSLLMFLLPALAVAFLCSDRPSEYLSVTTFPGAKVILLTFVSMFLLAPVTTLTGILNKLIKLPAFLEPVENWMQSMEAAAEQLTLLLLSNTDWVSVLMNLLVIAIAAAVTEEFLFRGTIQRIIEKWTANRHTVIWVTAFLFSAIHMQFYGFIPRLLLGAYFGYLLYWSRSIWLPVLAHFINNAVAVIGMSNESLKDTVLISGEIPDSEIIYFTIPAVFASLLFLLCVKALRKELITGSSS